MVVPFSLVNMERLKDRNVEMETRANIYVRKLRLLLVLNLTKWTIKINKEIKVEKNIKKIWTKLLAICWENWGSGKKYYFLIKKLVVN